jgi:ABC-type nitrate/sulfonate/bicarbonate transport system substrate-binding protein
MQKTDPNSHYLLTVAPVDKLKQNRDAYVKFVAGLIDAGRYIQDPKNADHVAEVAAPTGRNKAEAAGALKKYLEMGFWAITDDGLDRKKLDTVVATQAKIGGIKEGKTPVKYERLVDQTVWRDAAALAKK